MYNILLTSAGSLVGQCVLESLRGRRRNLKIIGANTNIDHDNLRECDIAIKTPKTEDPTFISSINSIYHKHQIELVIPCRDEDVLTLAKYVENEDLPINLLSARLELIKSSRDKYSSFLKFGGSRINFVDTLCTDDELISSKLNSFIERWGFPLVSKPRIGNASNDVKILTNQLQLDQSLKNSARVIQPFLNLPEQKNLTLNLSEGVPLFWEVPTNNFKAVSFFISLDGKETSWQCTTSVLRLGRLEQMREDRDHDFNNYAKTCLETLIMCGWTGPLLIQAGKDRFDNWHAFELNPRFHGGTSARQLLGFDEVGLFLNDWLAEGTVPKFDTPDLKVVHRTLRESPIFRE